MFMKTLFRCHGKIVDKTVHDFYCLVHTVYTISHTINQRNATVICGQNLQLMKGYLQNCVYTAN